MKIAISQQDTAVSYTQLACEQWVTPEVLMALNWNIIEFCLFKHWLSGSLIFPIGSVVRVKLY